MRTQDFLGNLLMARLDWNSVFSSASDDQLVLPVLWEQLSVKDILAQIVWNLSEIASMIEQRALAGSDWWGLSDNDRMGQIYSACYNMSLDEVRDEEIEQFTRLNRAVESLSDEELVNPAYWTNMPADWQPWQFFAANTIDQYQRYAQALRGG